VKGDRGCDSYRLDFRIVDYLRRVGVGLKIRVKRPQVAQTTIVYVTDRFELATGKGLEVADEVWPPVTATDYPYING